ncbi:hypothetical protein ACOME3_008199 [Neoechinorhynchus agilis]
MRPRFPPNKSIAPPPANQQISLTLRDIVDFTNSFSILKSVVDAMDYVSATERDWFLFASLARICLKATEVSTEMAHYIVDRFKSDDPTAEFKILEDIIGNYSSNESVGLRLVEEPSTIREHVHHTFNANHPAFYQLISAIVFGENKPCDDNGPVEFNDAPRQRRIEHENEVQSFLDSEIEKADKPENVPSCCLLNLSCPSTCIICCEFSPTFERVAFGMTDSTIRIMNVHKNPDSVAEDFSVIEDEDRIRGPVTALCFSNNEKSLLSGFMNGKIFAWDLKSLTCTMIHEQHYETVSSIDFSPLDQLRIV